MKKLIFTFAVVLCVLLSSCNNSNSKSTSNSEITYSSSSCITLDNIEDWGAEIKSHEFNNGVGKITFKGKVTNVPGSAFRGCTSLKSITLPNSITSIGDLAFDGCTSLTSITIPDSVTSIGVCAFYYCSSLTNVTIPNSVTSIGDWAFSSCRSLKAFYGKFASTDNRCLIVDGVLKSFAPAGLTSYTIPDSVTSIGNRAFSSCRSLKSITIPDSVTSIGEDAFQDCTSLKEVYCKATTPPTGGYSMFSTDNYRYVSEPIGCKIYVPRNSVEAYKMAEGWKTYADTIVGYDF